MSQKGFDPTQLVEEHGDYLFRYALMRLRSETIAEDVVQETLLAAIRSIEGYRGSSSVRTWLTSILKNKIVDCYRKTSRENTIDPLDIDSLDYSECFRRDDGWDGCWYDDYAPAKWNMSPEITLERKDFYKVFADCIKDLPGRLASAFTMREINELESSEICRVLDISPNNFWVMMHRSRMALRKCLELNWFNKTA